MFGDKDLSKAVTPESLGSADIEFVEGELWKFTTVRNLFESIQSEEAFSWAFRELIHELVRAELLNVKSFVQEPIFTSNISRQDKVLIAGVVHYHLYRRGLEVPEWVFLSVYRLSDDFGEVCELDDVLKFHGLQVSLRDIGVIEIE